MSLVDPEKSLEEWGESQMWAGKVGEEEEAEKCGGMGER